MQELLECINRSKIIASDQNVINIYQESSLALLSCEEGVIDFRLYIADQLTK